MLKPVLIFFAGALLTLYFLGAVERPIKDFWGNVKFRKNVAEQKK